MNYEAEEEVEGKTRLENRGEIVGGRRREVGSRRMEM